MVLSPTLSLTLYAWLSLLYGALLILSLSLSLHLALETPAELAGVSGMINSLITWLIHRLTSERMEKHSFTILHDAEGVYLFSDYLRRNHALSQYITQLV